MCVSVCYMAMCGMVDSSRQDRGARGKRFDANLMQRKLKCYVIVAISHLINKLGY